VRSWRQSGRRGEAGLLEILTVHSWLPFLQMPSVDVFTRRMPVLCEAMESPNRRVSERPKDSCGSTYELR
jgi:hypothetical protein